MQQCSMDEIKLTCSTYIHFRIIRSNFNFREFVYVDQPLNIIKLIWPEVILFCLKLPTILGTSHPRTLNVRKRRTWFFRRQRRHACVVTVSSVATRSIGVTLFRTENVSLRTSWGPFRRARIEQRIACVTRSGAVTDSNGESLRGSTHAG